MEDRQIILTTDRLSIDDCFAFINRTSFGGNCLFVGTVRGNTDGQVTEALEFESFEAMAKKEMEKIGTVISQRFGPLRCHMSHRLGKTLPGEIVVIIGVGAPHRKEAFAACQYAIDTLKETVPIWKKEILEDGSFWVNSHP